MGKRLSYIQRHHTVNTKLQFLTFDFQAISGWIFMQENKQKLCKKTFLVVIHDNYL